MSETSSTYPGTELTGDGPVTHGERINSLDIMRGVALFGILLMNIAGMGLPKAYGDPTVYGGAEGWDLAFVTSGVESDAGKGDGTGIFITRAIFKRLKS